MTVGTDTHPFERLVRWMDELAGELDEEVVIQTGHTEYETTNAESFGFIDFEKRERYLDECRLVVGHAGAGTILDALSRGKHIVVVPRRADNGEHTDDHQMELAGALADEDIIRVAETREQLVDCVHDSHDSLELSGEKNRMIETLRGFIGSLS